MEETLKELSGDLQMIHQSLERAEVVERQIGKYWREFAEERDQLRAEVVKLSTDLANALAKIDTLNRIDSSDV